MRRFFFLPHILSLHIPAYSFPSSISSCPPQSPLTLRPSSLVSDCGWSGHDGSGHCAGEETSHRGTSFDACQKLWRVILRGKCSLQC